MQTMNDLEFGDVFYDDVLGLCMVTAEEPHSIVYRCLDHERPTMIGQQRRFFENAPEWQKPLKVCPRESVVTMLKTITMNRDARKIYEALSSE